MGVSRLRITNDGRTSRFIITATFQGFNDKIAAFKKKLLWGEHPISLPGFPVYR